MGNTSKHRCQGITRREPRSPLPNLARDPGLKNTPEVVVWVLLRVSFNVDVESVQSAALALSSRGG